jgi:hypothetical protein
MLVKPAAIARADVLWGFAEIRHGRGIGRHPYAPGIVARAIGGLYPGCARCRREAADPVHSRPKRRKCAAFGIFAALLGARGPEKSTPPPGTPVA